MMQEQLKKQIHALNAEIQEIREELDSQDDKNPMQAMNLRRLLTARIVELDAAKVVQAFYEPQFQETE